jgi:hypothetical protein
MRPLFLAALAVLGLSACSSDEPTGGPGVHPDIRGSFVGLYQQTGVQAGVPDDFERLWAEAASGTIDLDGNVVLAWDNSPSCNVFDGDKQFAGTLVGNVLSLTAAYECDSWVYEDTYTGNRN